MWLRSRHALRSRPACALACLIACLAIIVAAVPAHARTDTCPACGAPVPPGAAFCPRCGHRLEGAPPPRPETARPLDPRAAAVQVIAVHDKDITSTYGAILLGSNIRVDSRLGSAFAVAPGEFVTDAAVVQSAREVRLRVPGGPTKVATVVGVDPLIGVALLRVDLPEPILLERRDGLPRRGEEIRSVGVTSAGQTTMAATVTTGVVSGLHRSGLGWHPIEDYIQTDASLADGFAGGPVVDPDGRLVGMSAGLPIGRFVVVQQAAGIGVSIPVAWIDRALAWIRAGQPPRPWLGLWLVPADPKSRRAAGLSSEVRWIVDQVFQDSPADRAGVVRGDGLLTFQGRAVESLPRLHEALLDARPGDTWKATVVHRSEPRAVDLLLVPRPTRPRLTPLDALRFYGGFELAWKGRALRVTGVRPLSLAADTDIRPGDVLQSVLIKKDLNHAERDNARWRSLHDPRSLEELFPYAYSDFDLFIGLRFRLQTGAAQDIYVGEILAATDAL
jgi:S1-C subfamily serine protease